MKKTTILLIGFLGLLHVSGCTFEKPKDSIPKDFDLFWKITKSNLDQIEIQSDVLVSGVVNNKKISLYKVLSLDSIYFHIWISEPVKEGKYKSMIRYSAYGRGIGNKEIEQYSTDEFMMKDSVICARVDTRGHGLSFEQIPLGGFLSNGIENKETYVYRGGFMDAVRAVDFVSLNQNSNGKIMVFGGSQGGLLSLVATALNNKVDLCVSNFPLFADIRSYNKTGWALSQILNPGKPNELEYNPVIEVLNYFDPIHFAKDIKVPIFISSQEVDDVTPSAGVVKLFGKIQDTNKMIYIDPCEGHGCSWKSNTIRTIEKTFIQKWF